MSEKSAHVLQKKLNFLTETFYLPPDPCECIMDLNQALAPFKGPGLTYLPAYPGGKAQTIAMSRQITDRDSCRFADGTPFCELPKLELIDFKTLQKITTFTYQGLTLGEFTLTLQPQSDDLQGPHKVLLSSFFPSLKDVSQTVEISYFVMSANETHIQPSRPSDEARPEETSISRRLAGEDDFREHGIISGPTPGQIQLISSPSTAQAQTSYEILNEAPQKIFLATNSAVKLSYPECQCDSEPSCYSCTQSPPLISCEGCHATYFKDNPAQRHIELDGSWSPEGQEFEIQLKTVGKEEQLPQKVTVIRVPTDCHFRDFIQKMLTLAPKLRINYNSENHLSEVFLGPFSVGNCGTPDFSIQGKCFYIITKSDYSVNLVWDPSQDGCLQAYDNFLTISLKQNSKVNLKIDIQALLFSEPGQTSLISRFSVKKGSILERKFAEPRSLQTAATNPDPPSILANVAAITSTTVIGLTWSSPTNNGGSPVIDYRVSWDQGSGTYVFLATGITSCSYTTAETLTAHTFYSFKVESRNDVGYSTSFSPVAQILNAKLPSPPLALANEESVTNTSQIGLTWQAPASNGGSPVIDYQIYTQNGQFLKNSVTTSCTISGLRAYGSYSFIVYARNLVGFSNSSISVNIIAGVKPVVPAVPTTSNAQNKVLIEWATPTDITVSTSIKIRHFDGTTFTTYAGCNVSANLSFTATRNCLVDLSDLQAAPYTLLLGNSVYAVLVATNNAGSSSSAEGNGAVIMTSPDPPSSLIDNPQLTSRYVIGLTWLKPTNNGGSPVIDYRVSWDQGTGTGIFVVLATGITGTTIVSYRTTATLTASTYYRFKVESRNAVGYSTSFSNEARILNATPPGQPLALANNQSVTTTGKIGLTWSAPTNDGYSPIIDYQIYALILGQASYYLLATVNNTTTSYTATGLQPYVVYRFAVQARNFAGLGNAKYTVNIMAGVIPVVPAVPTTSNAQGKILIEWITPTDITEGTSIQILQSDGTTFTTWPDCNVPANSTYVVQRNCLINQSTLQAAPYSLPLLSSVYAVLKASNAAGNSQSQPGNGAIIITNPDPPSSLANDVVITSTTVIGLNWSAPTNNGGSPVIDYRVSWDQGIGTYVFLATNIATVSYKTTATLTANTFYSFKVESRNAVGYSTSFSNEARILNAIPPDPPLALANNQSVTNAGKIGLTWSQPANDGGSPVIDYEISLKILDGGSYSSLPTGITTQSYTATGLTPNAIYSLRVRARNLVGFGSHSSAVDIRAAAVTSALAKPKTLLNSNLSVKITWVAPISDGGSPITYSVAIRQIDGFRYTVEPSCNVITTTCTIPLSFLMAAPHKFSWGTSIYVVVIAQNLVGSTKSEPSDGVVMITNPDPPKEFLVDPTTMLFTWDRGDFDGGTPVINYRILWDQGNSTYALLQDGISGYFCIAQINTEPSQVYKFKAQTRNQFGLSGYSNEVSFKTKGQFTLKIESMTFNVNINEEATLNLPVADGIQYTILSSHTFEISVKGNDLQALSQNEFDQETKQTVQMRATYGNQTVTFSVFLLFKLQKPAESTDTSQELAITEDTTALSTSANGTVDSLDLVDSLDCSTDDQGVVLCINAKGEFCSMDVAKGRMICSAVSPSNKKTSSVTAIVEKNPTARVSEISNTGKFSIIFSEAMNFDSFLPKKNLSRRLRGAKSGGRAKSNLKITNEVDEQSSAGKTNYLLSKEHLMIRIIPKPEFNSTLLNFNWEVIEITENEIQVQILFDYPLSVLTEADQLDQISIEFQRAALNSLKAKGTGLLLLSPLTIHVKFVPPQMYVGAVTQTVEKAAETMETVSQTTVIVTVIMQIVLSQAMSMMWLMVNALQIIIAMQSLNIIKPGNVALVLNNLVSLASFDLIQSATIIEYSFSFSETASPGMGFESMGTTNKRLIPYLGMAYLILLFVCGQYCLLYLAYRLKDKYTLANKYYHKFRKSLIWNQALLYMLESCLDIYTGVLLSLEQPMWLTSSDQCDFVFTIILGPVSLAFPVFCYFFLKHNISQLQEEQFEEKYGSLYESLTVTTDPKRSDAIKATTWFIFRRLLTAISIVPLRKQTVWIQLVCTMYLTLTDVSFKIHLDPYRTKTIGTMEKVNDMIVLVLTYFNFLFTDLIPDPVDRYLIGWCYVSVVAILLTTNLSLMIITGLRGMMESIKQKLAQLQQWWTKQQKPQNLKKELKIQSPRPVYRPEEETESQKLRRQMIQRQAEMLSEIQEESSQQSSQQSPRRRRIQTQPDKDTWQQEWAEIILTREQQAYKLQQNIKHYRKIFEKANSVKKFPIAFPESSPYYQPPQEQKPQAKSEDIISKQVSANSFTLQNNVKPQFQDELLPSLAVRLARKKQLQQQKKVEITKRSPYQNKQKKLTLDERQGQLNGERATRAKLDLKQDVIQSESN